MFNDFTLKFKSGVKRASAFLQQHPELVRTALEFGKSQSLSSFADFGKQFIKTLEPKQDKDTYDFESELNKYY